MLKFFKRFLKPRQRDVSKSGIMLVDLDLKPLNDGNRVVSLRYDLGESIVRISSEGIFYVSVEIGEQVSYTWMVDASTKSQKVKKI